MKPAVGKLRAQLREPGPVFTGLLMIPDPEAALALGNSGLDFVTLDSEQGQFTIESLQACVTALRTTPAGVVVRTATADAHEIERVLDIGVDGVMVPHVDDALEADFVVRSIKRHVYGSGQMAEAIGAGARGSDTNAHVAAIVIIESARGAANAEGIAAVAGLDAVMIGPADLAADLGLPGQTDHMAVRKAIEQVVSAAAKAGLKVSPWREPRSKVERDALLVCCLSDKGILKSAARDAVQEAKTKAANGG